MPRVKFNSKSSDGILAVMLTFNVIEALAKNNSSLGVTALAKLVGATKSRVYRHLVTLTQAGYVVQDRQTEKYRVGPRMVALAQAIITGVDIVAIARPTLARLRDEFGHTTLIARLEGEQIRVLDVALGTSEFSIVQRPGNVLSPDMLHCSALGKIALAFGQRDLVQNVLSRRLPKKTSNTITKPRSLSAEFDRVRKRGWSDIPDEGMIGFNALAVPIIDGQENLVAMIGIIGSTRVLPAKPSTNLISAIKYAGSQVSAALGRLHTRA
jgi:DNA-binding IclR family transcriptional regulator